MTTPGFTAEASLRRAKAYCRQIPLAPAAAELLSLAQTRPPVLLPPVQPVLPVPMDGRPVMLPPMQPVLPVPMAGLELYGNWCGPGNSGPGAPIDAVDQVCCLHDKCYTDRGYLDCSCDRDLVARMPGAIANANTPAAGRAFGIAAAAFFAVTPCLCHRVCFPFAGCFDLPGQAGVPGIGKGCPPGFA
jgi:hypothetical protein